jgi:hypothetical protein
MPVLNYFGEKIINLNKNGNIISQKNPIRKMIIHHFTELKNFMTLQIRGTSAQTGFGELHDSNRARNEH